MQETSASAGFVLPMLEVEAENTFEVGTNRLKRPVSLDRQRAAEAFLAESKTIREDRRRSGLSTRRTLVVHAVM
jgi:hypothetical protein